MGLKLVILFATCAILVHVSAQPQGGPYADQGGPHQNQGRIRRQAVEDEDYTDETSTIHTSTFPPGGNWTACDIITDSILSCYDCSTRMICKPIGGLLKSCDKPWRPHCNNGICSALPSLDCMLNI